MPLFCSIESIERRNFFNCRILWLKKRNFLFISLVLGLLIASFVGFQTAMASPMVTVNQPWWRTTGVNQPVEFTANATGGTPPYTFQWYTTYLDPAIPAEQWHTVMIPDSNSSTFKFASSIPGRYGISIRLSDSKGEGEYQSFQPIGIVVTVQTSPVPQLTPSPSPTPTPIPTQFWTNFSPKPNTHRSRVFLMDNSVATNYNGGSWFVGLPQTPAK